MTRDELERHLFNFLLSVGAVMLTAAFQAGITYISAVHPDLFAGASQLTASVAAVKFLGR